MKFKAEKTALIAALDVVAAHVDRGNSIPILGYIKIVARGLGVSITATNLNQAAQSAFAAEVETEGEICIPADTFTKSAKGMTAAEFTFTRDEKEGKSIVKAGKSTFRVPYLDARDFPDINMINDAGTCQFELDAETLMRIPGEVGFTVSDDDTRPFLHGVNWHVKDGLMVFSATDGRSASRIWTEAPAGSIDMSAILVPKIVMPKFKGNVKVALSDQFIRFQSADGEIIIASKLMDFQFPDIDRIIPKENPVHVMVNRDAMLGVVNRASVYMSGKQGSSIQFVAKDEELLVSAIGDNGDMEDMIACRGHDMDGCTISHRVLAPVLSSMTSEFVELRFNGPESPVTIHDPSDTDKIALAMPIKDKRWG